MNDRFINLIFWRKPFIQDIGQMSAFSIERSKEIVKIDEN